ncbi:MAG: SDR family oxidoreductase [Myxococcales bacterium]|nr:SDR family oxidoreductase [Polyangiaceae bacterium]MDW8250424.1 SDR family oxidoreductase [Myxococcales bacterium]
MTGISPVRCHDLTMHIVITGASRGIGLEFVRRYQEQGHHVEAAVRDPARSPELAALAASSSGKTRIHPCDVTSDQDARTLAASLGDVPVDLLINNAGILGKMQALDQLDYADILRTLDTNALGPLRVTVALLPHLRRGSTRKIVHISSGMGSISDNTSGGAYGYRMSKAALNMAARSMANDLRSEGFVVVTMNPGWVKTDMGGPDAPETVENSVRLMMERIEQLRPEQSGTFLDYRGHTWDW